MPLFPPLTDTLRWDDLVRQGRAQLPLVSPDWTDQNTSDPGIALLELLSWLVEADGYRSGVVPDRQRRLLLGLTGFRPRPARPATCLVTLTSGAGGPATAPAGLVLDGLRQGSRLPLTVMRDIAVSGFTVAAVASAATGAEADGYRTGCADLTRDRAAGRPIAPLGPDPRPGDAFMIGLDHPVGTPPTPVTVDIWVLAEAGLGAPESDAPGEHHSARIGWEGWDGAQWVALAAQDETAALTRTGRVRLALPALPAAPLGDQSGGALVGLTCRWVRAQLLSGRHDVAPSLVAVIVDAGAAVAAQAYTSTLQIPAGTPVGGTPTSGVPLPRAVISVVVTADGTVAALRFDPPGGAPAGLPAVDVAGWLPPGAATPGRLVADLAVLGTATGVPDESFELPNPWCGEPPAIWVTAPDGAPTPVRLVSDPVLASAGELAAHLDSDGVTVRFGDGRSGRTLMPGATVLCAGRWTTPAGLGAVCPPMTVGVPADARAAAMLGAAAGTVRADLADGLMDGDAAEDTSEAAARAEQAMWVHDRIVQAVRRAGSTSLDDLPLDAVRRLGVPERSVTAPDLERRALATPGTALWRARALPDVDPRLPGLLADGCVTVVLVPRLPVERPEPTAALRGRVHADLSGARTLGSRVFVVGPEYVTIGVGAELVLLPGADPAATIAAAETAVRAFLHPVTGGPSGRGWPFGRTVYRSEVLQLLDTVAGVDRVDGLVLAREPAPGGCGSIRICRTELVLAGTVALRAVPAGRPS
ncbi:hypothetical protein [Streptomyces sp. NPDC006446]|uniref:hypothetical protein n=1 Tax=Streptomyces sp. NPDC006446 TaxID=3154301 RepID=UPI0033A12F3A